VLNLYLVITRGKRIEILLINEKESELIVNPTFLGVLKRVAATRSQFTF